jgi:NAD(P)-dependent dehydrogenase (short-subunit alcohol dehydrogenase family)
MQNLNNSFRLDGRVALVAGAASGIGRAAARGLAAAGAIALCADINQQGAAKLAAEIRDEGGQAEDLLLDITDYQSVTNAIQSIEQKHHNLNVLVSTPGINIRKPLLNYTGEEFEKVLHLNLKGSFLIAQAAGRLMSRNKGGSIIFFSSIRSIMVEPGQGAYAATKAGLVQLARALAAELGSAGVRVNCIAHGIVDTPLTQPIKSNAEWYQAYASKNALGRWATADEMVGPVVFLASDASSYVTGAVLFVDGGWTAIDGRFEPPLH